MSKLEGVLEICGEDGMIEGARVIVAGDLHAQIGDRQAGGDEEMDGWAMWASGLDTPKTKR